MEGLYDCLENYLQRTDLENWLPKYFRKFMLHMSEEIKDFLSAATSVKHPKLLAYSKYSTKTSPRTNACFSELPKRGSNSLVFNKVQ